MRPVQSSPQYKFPPIRPPYPARMADAVSHVGMRLRDSMRSLSVHKIVSLALYCVFFIILQEATNFFPLARLAASPWSPETGLTVAAGVLLGWLVIPLAMLCHIIADSMTRGAPFLTVEFPASLLYALAYAGPGLIVRKWLQEFGHESIRFLMRFITLTLIAAFTFAASQAGLAVLIRNVPVEELVSPAFTLAVGDIIGILTVSPVFLLALRDENILGYMRQHVVALLLCVLAIVLISLFVFGLDSTDDFKFFYLLFVPVVALAVVLGLSGAIAAVLITDTSMMAIIYWREISPSTATELQLLMISLSVTGLVLGTIVHERGIFKQALILSQERLSESQSLLLHSSRVSVVSEMTTALAHELNQPLSAIKTYLRAIQRVQGRTGSDPAEIQHLLDETVAQVDHAGGLISKTRKFLKRGATPVRKSNLRHIISTSLALMEAELRLAHIETVLQLPKAMPPVWASEIEIQQVIINLLRNAKDAVAAKKGGERSITLSVGQMPQPGLVRIAITDTGVGVPEELRSQLFQPFATSKKDGLGLGLALCRSIVTTHGGDIWLDQDIPNATCFAFTLRTV